MSVRKYKAEDVTLREVNRSKKHFTGSRWKITSGEFVTVLGQTTEYRRNTNEGKNFCYYLIQFEDGSKAVVNGASLCTGKIKNDNIPSVFGVGYLGENPPPKATHRKEYNLWQAMLMRCYCEKTRNHWPTYADCSVDPRWHNYTTFCKDIKLLKNYKLWKENTIPRKYALDKDIKVEGNKVYSKDTCIFTTTVINLLKMKITGKAYTATRITDGYEEVFFNQKEFCKKYNLNTGSVSGCILKKPKYHTHKGWTFKIKEDMNG